MTQDKSAAAIVSQLPWAPEVFHAQLSYFDQAFIVTYGKRFLAVLPHVDLRHPTV